MAEKLSGKRVAFLFTEGAEQAEVEAPLQAVREAGADVARRHPGVQRKDRRGVLRGQARAAARRLSLAA